MISHINNDTSGQFQHEGIIIHISSFFKKIRTTGWHKFTFDYRSGINVRLLIDDVQAASSTTVTSFNTIYLGDYWLDGDTANAYFDDVNVH